MKNIKQSAKLKPNKIDKIKVEKRKLIVLNDEDIKRKEKLFNVIIAKQNLNFARVINKTPAEKIKEELQICLRNHQRANGSVADFIQRYSYNKLIVHLDLNRYQKDAYIIFFEELEQSQTKTRKRKKLTTEAISFFCLSLNEINLTHRGASETIEEYCKKVCDRYNLTYSDKVRQKFLLSSGTDKNIERIKEVILPNIEKIESKKLIEYFDSKQIPKQKMYN